MSSKRSGWGVAAMGLLLVAAGAYGMWFGWGIILNERGWSSFIAGAVSLSGGVVTIALGRVIAHLARLAPRADDAATPPSARASTPHAPKPPEAPRAETNKLEDRAAPLTEVDRYASGDEVYVMFADGTVEVSGPDGFKRYPSIAALRVEAEARKHK